MEEKRYTRFSFLNSMDRFGLSDSILRKYDVLSYISTTGSRFDFHFDSNELIVLDLGKIHKTLKKGGIAVFSEPLSENTIINLFRILTPSIRTPTEHPFRIKDIEKYGKMFSHYEYRCFQLFTLAIFFWMYLSETFKKEKSRYWQKIKEEHTRYESAFLVLQAIEERVFKVLPFLKKYGRMVVMKFVK